MTEQDLIAIVKGCTFLGAGLAMGFGAIGAGVGEGYTAGITVKGMCRQPRMQGELLRTMLLGQAVCESSGIFALLVALIMLFSGDKPATLAQAAAMIGGGLAVEISSIGGGIGTGFVSAMACRSIARHPEVSGKVSGTMLLGQAIATSPAVFGFIIALLLVIPGQEIETFEKAMAFLGAGIAMAIGALGPGLGIGWVASRACTVIGWRPSVQPVITRTMLIAGAVSETTSIYSFVVAVLLMYMT
jgi:ATP synthase F0 subunit c